MIRNLKCISLFVMVLFLAIAINPLTVAAGEERSSAKIQKQPCIIHASAGAGGAVQPTGDIKVKYGASKKVFSIKPEPGFLVADVLVDGISIGKVNKYTFKSVTSDHTLEVFFSRRSTDFFGMDVGNVIHFRISKKKQTTLKVAGTDISFSPSAIVTETTGSSKQKSWYQSTSEGLGLVQVKNGKQPKLSFSSPLLFLKPTMAFGDSWTSETNGTMKGETAQIELRATVVDTGLITTPAGAFFAYQLTLDRTITHSGQTVTDTEEDWFVPNVGVVQVRISGIVAEATSIRVAGGEVTTPPPIVSETIGTSGHIGDMISVNGYNFGNLQKKSTLYIGGQAVTNIESWSDNQITFTVPGSATTGPVVVTTGFWTSNSDIVFTVN